MLSHLNKDKKNIKRIISAHDFLNQFDVRFFTELLKNDIF